MKKRIILFIILAVVLVLTVFLLTRPKLKSMDQAFPSGVLGYLRVSHVAGDLQQFVQSPFWKNIASLDVARILEYNRVSAEDIKQLQKTQKELDVILANPLTKKFLGTEIALGVYEKNVSKSSKGSQGLDVLFATRIGFSLQMAELFISLGHQWGDDVTTTTSEKYDGYNIVHVHFNKRKVDLQYMRLHDVLFASFYPSDILHRVVDAYRQRQPALMQEEGFAKARSHAYPQGHVISYLNIQKFYVILKGHIPEHQKDAFDDFTQETVGFKSYSMSFMPGDVSRLKMIFDFEPKELKPSWRTLLTCSGSSNPSFQLVPHNAVVYNWGECYDLKNMWRSFSEGIQTANEADGVMAKWKHRIEKRFKLNVDQDVLPALGSQVGWYLNDVDVQGIFPYPRGVVLLKVENRPAADALMKKFQMTPLGPLQQEEYQNGLMHYLPLPLGENMDPGYAFVGDYLLLGSSRQLLRTSMDASKNTNQSLESNEVLKQFNMKSTETTQGVFFIKIEDVSERLVQLVDWYNKTVSSQITAALAYQQEALNRKKDLEESFSPKKEELRVAQNRFKALQHRLAGVVGLSEEERANELSNMEHLSEDIRLLKEDVDTLGQQEAQLDEAYRAYKNQAESGKLWLFNSDEVLKPVLKSLETLHALGVKWYLKDQISETEIFIK